MYVVLSPVFGDIENNFVITDDELGDNESFVEGEEYVVSVACSNMNGEGMHTFKRSGRLSLIDVFSNAICYETRIIKKTLNHVE